MSKSKEEEVWKLLNEIQRVKNRWESVENRSNNDKYYNTVDKVLSRGTNEGAAFKRSLLDLRMQISQTLKEI